MAAQGWFLGQRGNTYTNPSPTLLQSQRKIPSKAGALWGARRTHRGHQSQVSQGPEFDMVILTYTANFFKE